jgi:hypothetical protein
MLLNHRAPASPTASRWARFRSWDEGTEKVLDLFQERGAIDTIYLTTFTYGRGLAGRQIPGHRFPDHGSQESDEQTAAYMTNGASREKTSAWPVCSV